MIYTIKLTAKADSDEASIYNYIQEAFGKIYADAFRTKLIEFFHQLAKYPFIGRPAKNKIVYKIDDEAITVIRILNQKQRIAGKY